MKRTHLIVLEKPVVALADSREVRSMIANVVRCEVTRQLRTFEARGGNGTLRAVRDYACDVFGYTGKANHWLQMPSIHLDRECPDTPGCKTTTSVLMSAAYWPRLLIVLRRK